MSIREIKQHYRRFFGPEGESFDLTGTLPDARRRLEAPYFRPENDQHFTAIATAGASLHAMPDGRRVEGVLLLRAEPRQEELAHVQRLLAAFAAFPEAQGTDLAIGDVIAAKQLLAPLCEMDAVILLPPLPRPGLERLKIAGGAVDVCWLVPLYEAEVALALERGPAALFGALSNQGLDPMDLGRAALDVARIPEEGASRRPESRPPKQASFEAQTRDDGVITITRKRRR